MSEPTWPEQCYADGFGPIEVRTDGARDVVGAQMTALRSAAGIEWVSVAADGFRAELADQAALLLMAEATWDRASVAVHRHVRAVAAAQAARAAQEAEWREQFPSLAGLAPMLLLPLE